MDDLLIRNSPVELKMLALLKERRVIPSQAEGARRAIREKAAKHGITEEFCLQELAKEGVLA